MSDTHETVLTIHHQAGLHLRPAALFVQTAKRFGSTIRLTNLSRENSADVNAKSMLGLMQLGISQGHQIRVRASGDDAAEAIAALEHLIQSNFEEKS